MNLLSMLLLLSPSLCCCRILLCLLWLCPPHLYTTLHGCKEEGLCGVEGQRLDDSLPHRQLQCQRPLEVREAKQLCVIFHITLDHTWVNK